MGVLIRYALLAFVIYLGIRWIRRSLIGGSRPMADAPSGMKSGKTPWEVLKISPTSSQEQIKEAYYQQVQKYHPDKIDHMGGELKEFAQEKLREINWAYEFLSNKSN